MNHTVTLPKKFVADHLERCAAHPGRRVVLRETARAIEVRFSSVAWRNFVSDVVHYAGPDGPDDCGGAYRQSARACIRQLKKVGYVF